MSIDFKNVPINICAYYQDNKTSGVSIVLGQNVFGPSWPAVAQSLMKAMDDAMAYHESAEDQSKALQDSLEQLNSAIVGFNKRFFNFPERPLNATLKIDLNSREEISEFIKYCIVFLTTIYPLEKFGRIQSDNYNGVMINYEC